MDREVGKPTPFEFWTLFALCYFAREAVPWFVVWEAGLGGRWDSTNVAFPLVSVITNVGLDHIHLLGNTLGEIAEEKAGIIKPGVPVVSGAEDPDAIRVIEKRAKENKSDLYLLHRDFQVETSNRGPEDSVSGSETCTGPCPICSCPSWGASGEKRGCRPDDPGSVAAILRHRAGGRGHSGGAVRHGLARTVGKGGRPAGHLAGRGP